MWSCLWCDHPKINRNVSSNRRITRFFPFPYGCYMLPVSTTGGGPRGVINCHLSMTSTYLAANTFLNYSDEKKERFHSERYQTLKRINGHGRRCEGGCIMSTTALDASIVGYNFLVNRKRYKLSANNLYCNLNGPLKHQKLDSSNTNR